MFSEGKYQPSAAEQRSPGPSWTVRKSPDSLIATSRSGAVRLGDEMNETGKRVRRLEVLGTLYLHDNQRRPFKLICEAPFSPDGNLRDLSAVSYEPMTNYAPIGEAPLWRSINGEYSQLTRQLALSIVEQLPSDCGAEREEAIDILSQPIGEE